MHNNSGMTTKLEPASPYTDSEKKSKVERLFQFVRAFTNSRNPIRRRLSEQPARDFQIDFETLPDSSAWFERWSGAEDQREWLLRVHICPPPTPCEPPPELSSAWVLPGWDKHTEAARYIEQKVIPDGTGANQFERFIDHPQRQASWQAWFERRQQWAEQTCQQDLVRILFAKLQALRSELQKRSEQVELVLGVAVFQHQSALHSYQHPLIVKSLDITFDSQKNCFTLRETERPTELYTEPLAELGVDLSPAGQWRDTLQRLHPLDAQAELTVRGMGDWLRNQADLAGATLTFSPVIFLRDQGGWPSRAASAVLEDLSQRHEHDLPPYLLRLIGDAPPAATHDDAAPARDFVANEDAEILFALPANLEQLQLARQIERNDVVLVQGPPGTGKTHTIANLLGHFLSQGKRVLVTSHTSKALKVLRDKVPQNIQSM